MIRDLPSKIFSSKIFYIIFSLLVAFSLWLYVEISDAQHVFDLTIDAQVQITGEDILLDRDLFISSFTPEFVTLAFDTSRSAAAALRRGSLVVVIDVSRITSSGPTSLEYEIIYPESFDQSQISRVSRSTNRITLNIDRLTSKQILVEAPYNGGTASEYLVVDPIIIDPPIITVFGPEDLLSQISVAFVEILRENLSSTYIEDFPFILLDLDGEPLATELYDQLVINDETVRVTVPIRMIREVPLDVEFFYGAGTTPENLNYTIEPMSIVLTGDPDAFHDLNVLILGTVDTTRFGLRTANPEVFNIIHPSNLENVSGLTQAEVFVETIGLEVDPYSVDNIHAINAPLEYDIEILNERMVVRVRGIREDLDFLAQLMDAGGLNIRIEVDLEGLGPGVHRIFPPNVRISIDGVDRDIGAVGAIAEYIVTVRISE